MDNLDALLRRLLIREGGFVNHPADKGGATKFGITRGTLARSRGRAVTVQEVAELSLEEAMDIYRRDYVQAPGFMLLKDPQLIEQMVDAAVNHGPAQAVKMLQRAVKSQSDGILGPRTLARCSDLPLAVLYSRFMIERLRFFAAILNRDQSQSIFAAGWANRCAGLLESFADEAAIEVTSKKVLKRVAALLRLRISLKAKQTQLIRSSWFTEAAASLEDSLDRRGGQL